MDVHGTYTSEEGIKLRANRHVPVLVTSIVCPVMFGVLYGLVLSRYLYRTKMYRRATQVLLSVFFLNLLH